MGSDKAWNEPSVACGAMDETRDHGFELIAIPVDSEAPEERRGLPA